MRREEVLLRKGKQLAIGLLRLERDTKPNNARHVMSMRTPITQRLRSVQTQGIKDNPKPPPSNTPSSKPATPSSQLSIKKPNQKQAKDENQPNPREGNDEHTTNEQVDADQEEIHIFDHLLQLKNTDLNKPTTWSKTVRSVAQITNVLTNYGAYDTKLDKEATNNLTETCRLLQETLKVINDITGTNNQEEQTPP